MTTEKTYSQADFDKLAKQVEALTDQLEAEAAKTQRAVDAEKAAKAEARKLKDIDPADLAALEAENDKLRADLGKAQKEAKDATANAEKAVKALEAESGFTSKLLVQDGIKTALIAAGVKDDDFLDMAVAKFAGGAQVVQEGDARVAKIGDKALADVIGEWAASDAGKKFVSAPINSGGGAVGGSNGAGGSKIATDAQWAAMSAKAKAAFMDGGGQIGQAA